MNLLDKIVEGSFIDIKEKKYQVLGKVFYTTQKDPESIYAKILLQDHNVLVIAPVDNIAYFGRNEGKLSEFNSFNPSVKYNKKIFKLVNHDYQIVLKIDFGLPLDVEGEVEFWDYESDDDIISIAVISRNQSRADVVAKYIDIKNIKII